jgi:hypothetical protein
MLLEQLAAAIAHLRELFFEASRGPGAVATRHGVAPDSGSRRPSRPDGGFKFASVGAAKNPFLSITTSVAAGPWL